MKNFLAILICYVVFQHVHSERSRQVKDPIIFPMENNSISNNESQQPVQMTTPTPTLSPMKHPETQLNSQQNSQLNLRNIVSRFSWRLFRNSKLPDDFANLVLSPVMIQLLLSVLELGSAGETKSQLRKVIGPLNSQELLQTLAANNAKSVAQLELANALFVDAEQNLNRTFINEAKKIIVDILPVKFQQNDSKMLINNWISNTTRGTIPELLGDSYDLRNVQTVLGSAIYFKSTWKYRFNRTGPSLFYTSYKQSKPVQFMEMTQKLVAGDMFIDDRTRGKFVEIPYQNDAYSMVLVLPNREVSLDTFIRRMTANHLLNMWAMISSQQPETLTLRMPTFNIKSRFSVVNALLKIGLVDLFTINCKLPYIGLNAASAVTDILQQANLKVDENGTIATAAAAALVVPLSASYFQSSIVYDRPFLAIIFDKTNGIPMFISRVYRP